MSEFLVQLVEMIMKIGKAGSGRRRNSVLGHEYEAREERRSAIWVFAILVFLIGGGWLFFRWLMSYAK